MESSRALRPVHLPSLLIGAPLAKQTLRGAPEPKAPSEACPMWLDAQTQENTDGGRSLLRPPLSSSPLPPGQATRNHLHTRTGLSRDKATSSFPAALCSRPLNFTALWTRIFHVTKPSLTTQTPRSEKKRAWLLQPYLLKGRRDDLEILWEARARGPGTPDNTSPLPLKLVLAAPGCTCAPGLQWLGGLASPGSLPSAFLLLCAVGARPTPRSASATQPPKQCPESRKLQQMLPGLSPLH